MKKHTKQNHHKQTVGIQPYIIDSVEHSRLQKHLKPLHHNIEQVLKKGRNGITEIKLEGTSLELVEDERQAYSARQNRLLNSEKRKNPRARSVTRYQPSQAKALASSKNILGFNKSYPTSLVNYSVQGAALMTDRMLKKGSIIKLLMEFKGTQRFNCSAKVVYCEKKPSIKGAGKRAHAIGLKFLDISNEYKDFIIKEGMRQKLRQP
ncbi:MAG: hypothetical protein COB62_05125 [Piscirickettsiaceae bacterium]|nr:MAG: hypothetical protein COB62_05125 [Piscirickettsiaceae bacterium]